MPRTISRPIRCARKNMIQSNSEVAWLQATVSYALSEEADAKYPFETGGVLLGYIAQPNNVPVVLAASGPGPKAIHGKNHFRPDANFDEDVIAKAYRESARSITYMGDWHTHPSHARCLSIRDKRTLRRIARCRSARMATPIMLILVFDESWQPMMWQGFFTRKRMWLNRFSIAQLRVQIF